MIDPLMTKKEVAARLKVSVWKVDQLTSDGLLPVVRVGSSVRFRPVDVTAYVNKQASNKECVTKTTDFIGKSVAAKGEATEQDLRDATRAGVPASIKHAEKEALIKAVMTEYDCPRDAARDLIKAAKKRRKKRRKQQLAGVIRDLPTGSLPSSAQAANKARRAATADSAIGWLKAEKAEAVRNDQIQATKAVKPAAHHERIQAMMARQYQRVMNTSNDPAEREMAAKALDALYNVPEPEPEKATYAHLFINPYGRA